MMQRRLGFIAITLLATCLAGRSATASPITFDQAITSPAPPNIVGTFINEYFTPFIPPAGPATTLETQGFRFGGFGLTVVTPGNPSGATQPDLQIMNDPSQCPTATGNPLNTCISNGTHYLFGTDSFAIAAPNSASFAIASFQASQMFPSGRCAGCDDDGNVDLLSAAKIRVTGFRIGQQGPVAQQIFTLTSPFQTFILSNIGWQNVTRISFEPLDANGIPTNAVVAYDNIALDAVPEPASLALLGTGLVLLGSLRRRIISARPRS